MKNPEDAVSDESDKFLSISPDMEVLGGGPSRGVFSVGMVREILSSDFELNSWYGFIQSTVNPEAAKAIKDNSEAITDEGRLRVKFDEKLRGEYIKLVDALMTKAEFYHKSFPIVTLHANGANVDHPDRIFWPYTHVVRGYKPSMDALREMVGSLNEDEVYEIMTGIQDPFNYELNAINFLRDQGIDPLVTGRSFWAEGKTLKNIVDFFCQFDITMKKRPKPFDD